LTIKSTSHTLAGARLAPLPILPGTNSRPTRRCERYFFALHTCVLLMPVNIQLSKIDFLRIQESVVRKRLSPDYRLLTSLVIR
jgi:hypothetical protein